MDNNFSEFEEYEYLSDKDIFTKIWTSPKEVFKYINDKQYDKYLNALLCFAGIAKAFDRATLNGLGDTMSLEGVLLFCVIVGGLLGWISYYIYARLLNWTGKWIDGQGNTTSILRMLSYAMIPVIVGLVLLIPQIALYGNTLFQSNGYIESNGLSDDILIYGFAVAQIVLSIWTIVLFVVGLSEVQKLSIGKAILNLLLPILVIAVPIILIILLTQMA